MALPAGTRLGPYEIVAPLEAGGMGEVYRARDTRLDRSIAIKVVATELSAHPQLRERFQREARAIAALNHPNICTLHDVGHEGDIDFLVMELLDGETLAARLERGPLPLDRALDYAVHIANALDKAHRAGIVHRDLKPGNIMLTKSGAKLLDFGLAKRPEPVVSTGALSMLPTTPPNLTAQGAILGTFQYMAPEQLEGAEADARTDIFAFGTLVYEMVTGRKAFEGRSQVGLIGAILERDPTPVSALVVAAPPALDRILQRCLAKDPDDRWQSAGDLSVQLKWVTERTLADGPSSTRSSEQETGRPRSSRIWMLLAATFGLIAAALALTLFNMARARESDRVLRFTVQAPERAFFDSSQIGFMPALSPDGTKLAFTARDDAGVIQLWVRPLDSIDARLVPGTEGASIPFWSPDGKSLAFFARGKLNRIDLTGGPALTICNIPSGITGGGRGGTWNRNGVILFAVAGASPLYRVDAAGGEPRPATQTPADRQSGHRFPWFLPDGRHFIYDIASSTGVVEGVFIGALDSNETKRLVSADSNAIYSNSGDLLFLRENTLLRQPFDPDAQTVSGTAIPIAERVGRGNGLGAFSVSENGVLVYRAGLGSAGLVQLYWVDRTGTVLDKVGSPGAYRGIDLSPDGTRVAVHRHDESGGDVWLLDAGRRGGPVSRLTFDASQDNASPIWSPDGARLAFGSLRDGKWGVYVKSASGGGAEELVVESESPKMPMNWSADGTSLVYWEGNQKTSSDQWLISMSGDRKPRAILQSRFNESHAQISPNGRWIAYHSNETGNAEVYVRSFPDGTGKWQISSGGGTFPRWRRDGKELFFLSATSSGKLMSVKVNPSASTFESGDPVALFDSGYINFTHGLNYHTYAVAPDGQKFLIPRPEGAINSPQSTPITVVVNWARANAR